jgi:DnaJ family protein C protein 28
MAAGDERDHERGDDERSRRKRSWQTWESHIDEQIRQARERGAFDNLPGTGHPLHIDVNPYAGERALAFSLLKGQGAAPPEVALGQEIDADRRRADQLVAEVHRRRDQLLRRRLQPHRSERRAYNARVSRTATEYETLLRVTNSKALTLNVIAPAALHRPVIDVASCLQAFHKEFPLLAE